MPNITNIVEDEPLPKAYIVHRLPGRIRLKIPSKRRNESYFEELQLFLPSHPGISFVETNSYSASALLLLSSESNFFDYVKTNGLFVLDEILPESLSVTDQLLEIFQSQDSNVKTLTEGQFDISGLAIVALLLSGIYGIAKDGLSMPPWYVALYYAFGIFIYVHSWQTSKNTEET